MLRTTVLGMNDFKYRPFDMENLSSGGADEYSYVAQEPEGLPAPRWCSTPAELREQSARLDQVRPTITTPLGGLGINPHLRLPRF